MPVFNNQLAGAAGSGGAGDFKIERSLRLNDTDSAHLKRTFIAGNTRKWTWAGWVKRNKLGGYQTLFGHVSSAHGQHYVDFGSDVIRFIRHDNGTNEADLRTSAKYRDVGAWMHVCAIWDVGNSTPNHRQRLFVNGVEVTEFGVRTNPAQDYHNGVLNSAIQHNISRVLTQNYGAFQLADVHFLDGTVAGISTDDASGSVTGTPNAAYLTDFGEFSQETGMWNPKEYTHASAVSYSSGSQISLDPGNYYLDNLDGPHAFNSDGHTYIDARLGTGSNNTSNIIWQPTGGIQGVTKIRVHTNYATHYKINNGSWTSFTSNGTYAEIYNGSAITLNKLEIRRDNCQASDWGHRVTFYEINDVEYQNVGTNSFHLDFDPTASSQTYSTGGDDTNATNSGVGWAALFDTSYEGAYPLQNTTMNWTGSIPANGKNVRIGYRADASAGGSIVVNNVSTSLISNSFYNVQWADLGTFSADITSMSVSRTNVGFQGGIIFSYLEVDGKIVVNYEAPGVDVSGVENHWVPRNLSVTGVGVGPNGWPNKIGSPQSTWDSAATTSTVNSGTSWSTNGNQNTLHFDTQALGTHTITFTKTGGGNNIDFESSSSPNTGYSRVTNTASTITISSTTSSRTHSYNRYVRFSGSGSGNVTFSIVGTAQGTDFTGIDCFRDSPSDYVDGTNVGGNFATLNPLTNFAGQLTPLNGNLDVDTTGMSESWKGAVATIGLTSGKWYAEFTILDKYTTNHINIGINPLNRQVTPLQSTSESGHYYNSEGQFWNASSYSSGSYASYDDGDIIGVAVNFDTNRIHYYKNGTEIDYTNLNSNITTHGFQYAIAPYAGGSNVNKIACNFGQRPFAYPVSGYNAVCTQNLDDPLIKKGSDHFIAKKYTGSSGDKVVTTGFQPDFVWIKNLGQARWHRLADSVRGVARNLYTNALNGEDNSNNYNHKSFNTTGFTVWDTDRDTNSSHGDAYISWSWKGGSTFTNSAGSNGASVASSGTANQTAGFSIVSYEGNGSSGTVFHGLSSAPDMIWCKNRDANTNWFVYHKDLGTNALLLNSVSNVFSPSPAGINATSASTFTLGGNRTETNTDEENYIAYCFTDIDSYCKVGKFRGNASSNGTFVFTNFKPAFVMIKGDSNYDGGGTVVNGYNWYMYDNARDTYNEVDQILAANKAFPQESNADIDFLSNGFKLRTVAAPNANLEQYYIAFAENPFKYARAR